MKLKFGNIQLCEWQSYGSIKKPEDIYWARDFYPSDTYGDSHMAISITHYLTENRCHVIFYDSIAFLNDHFSQGTKNDLELAKEQVDNFLTRMNKLMVFL
jgi:hypothetical protein